MATTYKSPNENYQLILSDDDTVVDIIIFGAHIREESCLQCPNRKILRCSWVHRGATEVSQRKTTEAVNTVMDAIRQAHKNGGDIQVTTTPCAALLLHWKLSKKAYWKDVVDDGNTLEVPMVKDGEDLQFALTINTNYKLGEVWKVAITSLSTGATTELKMF